MTTRAAALDEIEAAHRVIGGTGRGRRYATLQINYAYTILLSSHFQGYCRDLHSECANWFVDGITSPALRASCRNAIVLNRKLDRGNPHPGHLGEDFKRFGVGFWDEVRTLDARNRLCQNRLEELNHWRNAVAHQDFDPAKLGARPLHLGTIRRWRRVCDRLATAFDEVMRRHLQRINAASPW